MKKLNLRSKSINHFVEIPVDFIDTYLPEVPEEALKVYLYLLWAAMDPSIILSLQDMADLFDVTPKKIVQALCYWESYNVLALESVDGEITDITILPVNPKKADEIKVSASAKPVTEPENIGVRTAVQEPEKTMPFDVDTLDFDPIYSDLLSLAEYYLRKPLAAKLRDAIGMSYLILGKREDLTEYLIEYCIGSSHYSPNYMEAVARGWAEKGLTTMEEVQAETASRNRTVYTIMNAFGLRNREPAGVEQEYIDTWTKNFDISLIVEACNRTMSTLHSPDFKYANAILERWKAAGIFTKEGIEEQDRKHAENKEKRAPEVKKNAFHNYTERQTNYDELVDSYVGS